MELPIQVRYDTTGTRVRDGLPIRGARNGFTDVFRVIGNVKIAAALDCSCYLSVNIGCDRLRLESRDGYGWRG